MIQVAAFSFFHQILIFLAIIIAGILAIVWGIGWAIVAICRKVFSREIAEADAAEAEEEGEKKTD